MIDHHRPMYHLLPPANWMNDPNGLIQHNGVFHVFYQHNPYGALWGNMSWGHARSSDLVHWEHLPLAIVPDSDGQDADGCYSGVLVEHDGTPTMVYTGVRKPDELCCLAFPEDDELVSWRKFDGNPVISGPPEGVPVTIFRDHTLWREGDTWYMGVGSGIEERGGAVLLYRSNDLKTWQYLHPLAIEQPELNEAGKLVSTGWECPDFFFLDGDAVLLACEWDGDPISSSWWRGEMADYRFAASSKGLVDAGDVLYAPQTFAAADGRRLLFGWLRELRSDQDQVAAGWSGVMSLPREVMLREDNTLAVRPAAEVTQLRGERQDHLIPGGAVSTSSACELRLTLPDMPAGDVRLTWADVLTVSTDGTALHLVAGDRHSVGTITGDPLANFDLRVFIDHSVVEVYLGDRIVMSTRVYTDLASWNVCELTLPNDMVASVSVWSIASIWN